MIDKPANESLNDLSPEQDVPNQGIDIPQKKLFPNRKLLGIAVGALVFMSITVFYILTSKTNDQTRSVLPPPQTSNTISPKDDDNPKVELYLSISEKLAINQGRNVGKENGNILLELTTKKLYGCDGYKIDSDLKIEESTIEINFRGVKDPVGACNEVMSPAIFSQDMGKLEGQYVLTVKTKNEEDKYTLIITTRDINIQTISSSITSLKRGNILRFPTGTVIVGCWKNQEALCSQFFNDLQISGASETENQEYAIGLNKDMKEKAGEVETPTDFVLYSYSGASLALDNLINKYAQNKGAMIEIYTWDGNTLFTWTRR